MTFLGCLPSMRNFLSSPAGEGAGGLTSWILILQTSRSPAHWVAPFWLLPPLCPEYARGLGEGET